MNLFHSLVMYWSDRIEEETEKIAPIRTKLNDLPHVPLTQKETLAVRRYLVDMRAFSELLARDATKYNLEVIHKKTFIQKLLRK